VDYGTLFLRGYHTAYFNKVNHTPSLLDHVNQLSQFNPLLPKPMIAFQPPHAFQLPQQYIPNLEDDMGINPFDSPYVG
jgi:hypothetical protein